MRRQFGGIAGYLGGRGELFECGHEDLAHLAGGVKAEGALQTGMRRSGGKVQGMRNGADRIRRSIGTARRARIRQERQERHGPRPSQTPGAVESSIAERFRETQVARTPLEIGRVETEVEFGRGPLRRRGGRGRKRAVR